MAQNASNLATRLYEDIVIGALSFGTKLTEEVLAERYQTKRHVLREAFGQLEEIGFVKKTPNRGVFVREPSPREMQELFELREMLETKAASLFSLPIEAQVTDKLDDIQRQHSAAVRENRFRDVLHLNAEFHRVQYSPCPNRTLVSAVEYYATRAHLITAMKFSDVAVMDSVIAEHEAIIAAMKGTDRDRLIEAIRAHFDYDRVRQYEREYRLRHPDAEDLETRRPRRGLGS